MFDSKENIISTIEADTGLAVTAEELDAVINLFKLASSSNSKKAEEASESTGKRMMRSSGNKAKAFIEFLALAEGSRKAGNTVASLITAGAADRALTH
jgi:hypothetical protein